jgi:hypothetical protein
LANVMEELAVDQVISSRLKGDSALAAALGGTVRLHADLAPENEAQTFWIVFELIDNPDTNAMGGAHVMARPFYSIRVCGRDTGYQVLGPACNRVYELLVAGRETKLSMHVGRFVRRGTQRGVDEIKNLRVYWIGQMFDVRVNPA